MTTELRALYMYSAGPGGTNRCGRSWTRLNQNAPAHLPGGGERPRVTRNSQKPLGQRAAGCSALTDAVERITARFIQYRVVRLSCAVLMSRRRREGCA
jgi:hypothetical protein